jgi:hypothetical protein
MRQRVSRNSIRLHVTVHREIKEKLKQYADKEHITMALALEKILSVFFSHPKVGS